LNKNKSLKSSSHRHVNTVILENGRRAAECVDKDDALFQGTVIIIANHGDRIDIPSGAMLENKIVSGNMRILDH
jgi:hypothetical protein